MKSNIFDKVKTYCLVGSMLLSTGFLASCSQDTDEADAPQTQGALRFEIYDGGSSRAVTDGATMKTTFETGDKAGLYAVKGGQVVLNNVPLTYSANGFWEATESLMADGELSGAQFYAYYPYNLDAQFDATASAPFAKMVAATVPAANQSSKTDFEAADVMITTATTVGQYNTVRLALVHQKALVCVELPNTSYVFTNTGMDPYVMAKSDNVEFTLNGSMVYPYFDAGSQSYRYIVEPGSAGEMNVAFTTNGKDANFKVSDIPNMQQGQYAKYVVNGGAQLITTTLQEGDYYCSDGRIVSKDTPESELPSNIIGIVYKLSTTDAIRSANSNWSHAVVICTGESAKLAWAATKANDIPSSSTWYLDYGLATQNGTNASNFAEEMMPEEGYETTQAWLTVPEDLSFTGYTGPVDLVSVMKSTLTGWVNTYPVPAGICSGWYIPSMKDWQNIEAKYDIISQQLEKAGGVALRWDGNVSNSRYWTPNLRDRRSMWAYVGNKTALGDRYKGPVLSDANCYYRYLLAF